MLPHKPVVGLGLGIEGRATVAPCRASAEEDNGANERTPTVGVSIVALTAG